MIVESPAALRLMAALMDADSTGATREQLVHRADIGTTSFYRLIGRLIEKNLVTMSSNRYQLPLTNLYNLRFKLWHDAERLYRLSDADRSAAVDIMHRARRALGDNLRCLWLVGSAAQGELRPTSDLDFVAVVHKSSQYHPTGGTARPVNFVVMTESEFRDRQRRADGFIASALRYGIVVFDRDFAEAAYSLPAPAAASSEVAREEEDATEQLRTRALLFLEGNQIDQARDALRAYGTSVGRLMLRTFGQLPASRTDLITAAGAYFGGRFGDCLSRALGPNRLSKAGLVKLSRELADYHHAFQDQVSHLKSLAALPSADELTMETLCARVLRELVTESSVMTERRVASEHRQGAAGRRADIQVRQADGTLFTIECKSLTGRIPGTSVSQMSKYIRGRHPSTVVLIANAHRDLPPLERPEPFTDEARSIAASHGIRLWTGLDVLRAHNTMHLERESPETALRSLLSAGRCYLTP